MDHEKLTKVLMLTTSDADGEALNAIRRANAMLQMAGLNWEQFLSQRRQDTPRPEFREAPRPRHSPVEKADIEHMLDACTDGVKNATDQNFVRAVANFYRSHGHVPSTLLSTLRRLYYELEL